jgi:ABC-type polar amino acid transport system ATPase subunit
MININHVSLTLKGKQILNDISLTIPQGSLHCLIGQSGAGKTSLLKCIASLQQQYTGSIEYQGRLINAMLPTERAHTIGFVFQHFNLFPHMTVLENCVHPMVHVLNVSQEIAQKKAVEILAQVGMEQYKDSYPQQLSGGQQQRVAIARALCLEPKILLFDEPTSALDPESSRTLVTLLKTLKDQGITSIISSHDMAFVKAIHGNIHFISEGKLIESYDQQSFIPDKIKSFLDHATTQPGNIV